MHHVNMIPHTSSRTIVLSHDRPLILEYIYTHIHIHTPLILCLPSTYHHCPLLDTLRSLAASSEKALLASTASVSAGGDHDTNKANAGDGQDVSNASKPLMPWLDWLGSKLAGDQKDAAGGSYTHPLDTPLTSG